MSSTPSETSTDEPTADHLAEHLLDAVNRGVDGQNLAETIGEGHNYLQNELFFEVLKPLIISYANRASYDRRNEAAVKTCREIVEAMGWKA